MLDLGYYGVPSAQMQSFEFGAWFIPNTFTFNTISTNKQNENEINKYFTYMAYELEHQHHVFTQTEHFFFTVEWVYNLIKISNMNMTARRDICKRDYLFSFYWARNWKKKHQQSWSHLCTFFFLDVSVFGFRKYKISSWINRIVFNCLPNNKLYVDQWSVNGKKSSFIHILFFYFDVYFFLVFFSCC